MTDSDRYSSVVQLLDALLVELNSVFTTAEIAEVQHFIDVNEFGLALETACDIVREEHRPITPAIASRIDQIGRLMGVSDGHLGARKEQPE